MMLSGEIRKLDDRRYAYTGQVRTYNSFASLSELLSKMPSNTVLKRYLPLRVKYQRPDGRIVNEPEETPEAMALRLAPYL
jgi:hypothetical protein